MSMNFNIFAEREILVIKTGKHKIQRSECFDVYQTPTEKTKEFLKADDPIEAYIEWILETAEDMEIPVFAPGDIFHPIGTETINWNKDHVKVLRYWIKEKLDNGWVIKYEEI